MHTAKVQSLSEYASKQAVPCGHARDGQPLSVACIFFSEDPTVAQIMHSNGRGSALRGLEIHLSFAWRLGSNCTAEGIPTTQGVSVYPDPCARVHGKV